MTKTVSLLSALLCTLIWGTTFIAQDTGMDEIGPFTFNAVRFFVGFLAITPLVFLFELKKFKSEFKSDVKTFGILSFLIGLSQAQRVVLFIPIKPALLMTLASVDAVHGIQNPFMV